MRKYVALNKIMLFTLVVSMVVFSNTAFAELPFGMPKANTNTNGVVPLELAQKIAIKIAHEKWGKVAVGPALPCSDDDGDIVAYMFPFAIGEQAFPAYADILSKVQYGRKIEKDGFGAMNNDDQKLINDYMKNGSNKYVAQPDTSKGQPQDGAGNGYDKANLDKEAKVFGKQKMIGAEQFGTIVVSARDDRYPVPFYTNYLPPYFFNGDKAVQAAGKILSSETVTLEKIFFLENLQKQYMEFSSNGKTTLINAYSLEAEPVENVLMFKGKRVTPASDVLSDISTKWAEARKAAE